MSLVGILGSSLLSAGVAPNTQTSQNTQSNFQAIKTEFEQLGQDLQSGNLTQAQQDFGALSQNFPSAAQSSTSPALQAFTQLGQDLQSGNLSAAQKDYTTLQQDTQQQNSGLIHGHRGHHQYQPQGSQSSSSSQQTNPLAQAFGTLAADLQGGNLSGAQSAYTTLASELQQIGASLTGISSGGGSDAASAIAGTLNVTA
jgi:outer membrane protein assembly factor BamD (BamD/ComL family)